MRRGTLTPMLVFATAAALLFAGCGGEEEPGGPVDASTFEAVLAERGELLVSGVEGLESTADGATTGVIRALGRAAPGDDLEGLVVDYPFADTVFPPEIVAPTFLWHDEADAATAWLVKVAFADGGWVHAAVTGPHPQVGEIDRESLGKTNEIFRGTPYQQSARTWTPSDALWETIKRRSVGQAATVEILGVRAADPTEVLSRGTLQLTTSADPVGAPVFYRDVPLIPAVGESGVITPLDKDAYPMIAWRLRDVSRPESKLVLTGMPACANCHSFSLDGSTLGMDVDGPQGDKGTYAITPLGKETVIEPENVITWNSFENKPEGHRTIGFLSRLSPDGTYALTTLNEDLYVSNFSDYKFLQVFFPTRGILAWYSTETKEMKALPGADDTQYVHTNGVWTPDGKTVVFSRSVAFDPHLPGQEMAKYANDPNEPRIRYNLYRIPFDEGRGGAPEPIEGASHNGMSNTFPKVSPDGKWIVFTKCRNGQLMRPDGRLWIVPAEGGTAREMECNLGRMNSWHSFSPNSRWMVFSSKQFTPYTQMFLTHIDAMGHSSPAVLVPNCTLANRAVNIPEFVNRAYDEFDTIRAPAVNHHLHMADGIKHMKAGRHDQAIAELEKALELEPDFSRAHANLGNVLLDLDRIDEAVGHFQKALESNAESEPAWVGLGRGLRLLRQPKESAAALRQALEVSPMSPFVHNEMGLTLKALEQDEPALLHFERAVALNPDFADARKSVGYELLRLGRSDEALEQYRSVVALDPADAVAHRSISHILLAKGELRSGLEHLAKAVDLAPEDTDARIALAFELATSFDDSVRNGARAVEVATEACELTGWKKPAPLDVLAAAYAEAGRFQDATEAAKRALALAEAGQGPVAKGLEGRLALYRQGRPYRQVRRR